MFRKYRTPSILEDLTEKPETVVIIPEMAHFVLDGKVVSWTLPEGLVGDADTVFKIVEQLQK